jgi:cysteinyl-tRNA synthetase
MRLSIPSAEGNMGCMKTTPFRTGLPRAMAAGFLAAAGLSSRPAAAVEPPEVRRPDGAVQLTFPAGRRESSQNAAFSPDGTRILFTRFHNGYNEGPAELIHLDLATRKQSVVLPPSDSDNVNVPGLSWVNGQIVWASDRGGGREELFAAREDGADIRQLTRHPPAEGYYLEPVFHPADPRKILFETSSSDERTHRIALLEQDRDGRITFLTDGSRDDRLPNGSYDGKRILFQRATRGEDDWQIWVGELDFAAAVPCLRNLSRPPQPDTANTDGCWHPNGRFVLVSSDFENRVPNIVALPLAGGAPVRVTRSERHEDGAPCVSPDGRWVAFESHRRALDEDSPSDLFLIEAPAALSAAASVPAQAGTRPMALGDVKTWMYQIQELEADRAVGALARSPYDLLVVEPTATVKDSEAFDMRGMVAALHAGKPGRLVLAYLDVGEAEEYRTYWEKGWRPPTRRRVGNPPFMLLPDPDGWAENYVVAYWDEQWQALMCREAGRLMEAGFDGLYLDWVEAYDDEQVARMARAAGVAPARAMVGFIGRLREAIRAARPGAVVVAQNAPYLLDEDPTYADVIDALACEDTWFRGEADAEWHDRGAGDIPNRDTDEYGTSARIGQYRKYLARGKPVFTVDYCLKAKNAAMVYRESRAQGFVPLVTRVGLQRLTETPPP